MTTNACTRRMGTFVFKAFRKGHDKQRGWTQVYMAEHVGMDRSFISDLENGEKEICIRNLEVLADAFGVSVSQLLSRLQD